MLRCRTGGRGKYPAHPSCHGKHSPGLSAPGLSSAILGSERSLFIFRCAVPLGSTMIRVHLSAFTSHILVQSDYNAPFGAGQPPTKILPPSYFFLQEKVGKKNSTGYRATLAALTLRLEGGKSLHLTPRLCLRHGTMQRL